MSTYSLCPVDVCLHSLYVPVEVRLPTLYVLQIYVSVLFMFL
jgi:hypothetical protein